MCLNPIKIKSPKLVAGTFLQGVDPCELTVPCGHCPECSHSRVNDIVFRCFYEYIDCKKHGGFSLFQTLTYSDFHVKNQQGFYFFCKKDVQLFLKRLRRNLERFHSSPVDFKYIIVSEYGDNFRRPHYHPVFFVHSSNITPAEFDKYVKISWSYLDVSPRNDKGQYKKLLQNTPIGIVDNRDVNRRVINSIYAIQYICKYITKGSEVWKTIKFYPHSFLYRYFNNYLDSNNIDKDNLQDYQIKNAWLSLKSQNEELYKDVQLFPFYLQSKGLGMAFLETCCYEDLFDTILIDSNGPLGYTEFHIPQYYIRKVFYDYDKDTKRYKINSLGIEYKKHVNNETFHDFLKTYEQKTNNEIRQKIDNLLAGRSYSLFAYYNCYLRNRTCPPPLMWLADTMLCEEHIKDFIDIYQNECFQSWLDDNPTWVYAQPLRLFGIEITHKYDVGKFILFNNYPIFKDFDKINDILQDVKSQYNKAHCKNIKEQMEKWYNEKSANAVHKPLNSYVY